MVGLVGLVAVMGMIVLVMGAALARARSRTAFSSSMTEETALVNYDSRMEAGGCLLAPTGPPTPIQPQPARSGGILKYLGVTEKTPMIDPDIAKDGDYLGKISFRLSYCRERHTFSVHILEAVDLPAMDIGGSSDPYVRVSLLPNRKDVKFTKIHRRSLCPKFAQTLNFPGHTPKTISSMTLCVQVMDYDRFSRDDPIGEILLPMKNVKFTNEPVYWKQLQKPTVHKEFVGEVLISLCYLFQSNRLNVVVSKAKDLPAKDVIGTSDPYVKLWWVQNGIKMEKHKTTVKNHTLNPLYNEAFTFILPPKDTLDKDAQLVITVMDHDLLSSNDEIGHVVIGSKSGTESGIKHWKDILNHPDQPISVWHQLSPKW